MDYPSYLKKLLSLTAQADASDLHIAVRSYPTLRISGRLVPLLKEKQVKSEEAKGLAFAFMTEEQRSRFLTEKEIDFSYNFENRARFRVNIFNESNEAAIACRLIPAKIRTVEELNLPSILHHFTRHTQGFVLITGPSGQGKSTTLAALIDEINHTRSDHIITIEDPIEYVFEDDKSIIAQREVYQDTLSFARALKSSFREDPNVIMVGEMRDPETMSIAISAAETGHLVFATLHTNSAAQTIHRIVDSFAPEQQNQIRAQFSASLLGVLSQRLVPRIKGGLIPACEVMINNPAISTLVRENKIHEIPLVIETSADIGMISLNRSLADLIRKREISLDNALLYSLNPSELRILVKR